MNSSSSVSIKSWNVDIRSLSTPTMAQNLETLTWLLGMESPPQDYDASKYLGNLGLIAMAKATVEGVIQVSLVEFVYALIRRLNLVGIGWLIRRPTQ